MTGGPRKMFVERQTYRKRRLRDAARFLPVVGGVLFLLPLFWPRGPEAGIAMSAALEYIFLVWAALVLGALILSILVRDTSAGAEGDEPDPAPRGER